MYELDSHYLLEYAEPDIRRSYGSVVDYKRMSSTEEDGKNNSQSHDNGER